MKNDLNGWLVLDKPLNMTSAQAVGRLKRLYSPLKIGHTGTLDPLATGVLPIAFGKATKLIPYMIDGVKEYVFQVCWGSQTQTDDAEGQVTATSPVRPSRQDIERILPRFFGKISQVPPIYSALKVQGQRSYALARQGQEVVLPPRSIEIFALELRETTTDSATFFVRCSKGTYVRALGRDIARALGTCGFIQFLRRVRCGPFGEQTQISLDSLEKMPYNERALCLKPLLTALDDILVLAVNERQAQSLLQGQAVIYGNEHIPEKVVVVQCDNVVVALCQYDGMSLKPKRVLLNERKNDVAE